MKTTGMSREIEQHRFLDQGIAATGLARSFGSVKAVENIDFHAEPGQVTALIGPNGSGKTTLLLMLASLLRPDAGTIRVNGLDPLAEPRAVRSMLGWMPDTLGFWEALTSREILTTVAALYGIDKARAKVRANELLDVVGLGELADTPARVLSRGQAQRLSMARALINDPAVLLLDEPASGLDPGARVQLRTMVRGLADSGKTVVISSHVLVELDEMADAAVFLSKGKRSAASHWPKPEHRIAATPSPPWTWPHCAPDWNPTTSKPATWGIWKTAEEAPSSSFPVKTGQPNCWAPWLVPASRSLHLPRRRVSSRRPT